MISTQVQSASLSACSNASSLSHQIEKEGERTLFCWGWVSQWRLTHLTERPRLQVLLPPGEHFEVVVNSLVLEEQLLVSPQGRRDRASHHDASDQVASGP